MPRHLLLALIAAGAIRCVDDPGTDDGGGSDQPDLGFPAGTPIAQMTTEQAAAYWRYHSRKHEGKVREYGGITPEQVKAMQEELEGHRQQNLSEQERLIEEARAQARAEALAESAVARVQDAITTHLEARLPARDGESAEDAATRRARVAAVLNATAFVAEGGEIQRDALMQVLDDLVAPPAAPPAPPRVGPGGQLPPASGIGARAGSDSTPDPWELGRAEAAKRFGPRTTT